MSKRQFQRGTRVATMDEILNADHYYFILTLGENDLTRHKEVLLSFQVRTLLGYIRSGFVYHAIPIRKAGPE